MTEQNKHSKKTESIRRRQHAITSSILHTLTVRTDHRY